MKSSARIICFSVALLSAVLIDSRLLAATPFFWDVFERENIFDSTVAWYDDPTPEEDLSIVDGSLVLQPLQYRWPDLPEAAVEIGEPLSNFRIETQFAFENPSNNPLAAVGMWKSGTTEYDWAGILADGRFTVGVAVDGDPEWRQEPTLADQELMTGNDVFMVAEVVDGEQTLTVWLDGDEQNAMSVTDRRITSEVDFVEVTLNPQSVISQSVFVRHFALLPLIDGDYNASGNLDVGDIDLMADQLRSPDPERVRVFDVNGDGDTNLVDHTELVTQLFGTSLGDANLDGNVNFDDFLALSTGFGNDGDWAQGDFDANGTVEFADFLLLSANFGTNQTLASVPEPSLRHFLIPCFILATGTSRRRTANA